MAPRSRHLHQALRSHLPSMERNGHLQQAIALIWSRLPKIGQTNHCNFSPLTHLRDSLQYRHLSCGPLTPGEMNPPWSGQTHLLKARREWAGMSQTLHWWHNESVCTKKVNSSPEHVNLNSDHLEDLGTFEGVIRINPFTWVSPSESLSCKTILVISILLRWCSVSSGKEIFSSETASSHFPWVKYFATQICDLIIINNRALSAIFLNDWMVRIYFKKLYECLSLVCI